MALIFQELRTFYEPGHKVMFCTRGTTVYFPLAAPGTPGWPVRGSCTNRGPSLRGVPGSCSTRVQHIREFLTRILAAVLTEKLHRLSPSVMLLWIEQRDKHNREALTKRELPAHAEPTEKRPSSSRFPGGIKMRRGISLRRMSF